jgi:ribosomal protein S18 acetylase RimI-like enzyme
MWSRDLVGAPNVVEIWIPSAGFVKAERTAGGLSVSREDGHLFGMGIGPSPAIDPLWERMALPQGLPRHTTEHLRLIGRLDVMTVTSTFAPMTATTKVLVDPEEIRSFLTMHAPDSHTYPDSPESRLWYGIREDRKLVAVGAMTQWESGATMLASVATHREYRGKGLATAVARDAMFYARKGGVSQISLAVTSDNAAAIRAYARAGFMRLAAMSIFEPVEPLPINVSLHTLAP